MAKNNTSSSGTRSGYSVDWGQLLVAMGSSYLDARAAEEMSDEQFERQQQLRAQERAWQLEDRQWEQDRRRGAMAAYKPFAPGGSGLLNSGGQQPPGAPPQGEQRPMPTGAAGNQFAQLLSLLAQRGG